MRQATITSDENGKWTNKHGTVTQPFERLYYIETPKPRGDPSLIIQDMHATANALQAVLRDAIAAKKRLRCIGGAWSLSECAATDGWLLSTKSMNLYWIMRARQLHSRYKKAAAGLYLAQCGVSVQELNQYAEKHKRALTTSGASNGQTIAGAIATGTHGSAFQFGSMTEYVVGFHLVISPAEIIWLERASYPVVSDDFATELGAVIRRDDDLFNAVLVSFGSFGIVAGVMVETEPVYLFEGERRAVDLPKLTNAMNTMQLQNVDGLPNPGETPWHFEVTFNPHDTKKGYVQTLFKRPFSIVSEDKKPKLTEGGVGPGEGLLSIVATLTELADALPVAVIVGALVKTKLQIKGHAEWGTNNEIFTTTFLRGKAHSMELGIAMEDASRVLDLMCKLPEIKVYAGVISYRWVKQSSAMLGFTKFPVTATVEFNAAHNRRTLNFYEALWSKLEEQDIPYTLHWGQMHNFTPERVRRMYGDAIVDKWIACRENLLSEAVRQVFSSPFMTATGLG